MPSRPAVPEGITPSALSDLITPEMDRHNRRIYLVSFILGFFGAPVLYVGVVQATLLDKLGASATVTNLPAATYTFGSFAPLLVSWIVPYRFERSVVVWSNHITATVFLLVFLSLVLPVPASVPIAAVILQGLLQGFTGSTAHVFMMQCLTRGTTIPGRIRTLKQTYAIAPLAAVAGSLGAQYVLNPGIPSVPFPYDFALLYLIGIPCALAVAILSSRYDLIEMKDQQRKPILPFLAEAARGYSKSRPLVLLWLGYLLWYSTLLAMPTLSLYAKVAMRREPKDFAGLMMAIRFGCKCLGGYGLGFLAQRRGLRASVMATIVLVGGGILWAWLVPGYSYLFAFGLMGAGELGGAYFPNYVAVLSPVDAGTRNLSLVTLATSASSFAPPTHGALTDVYGFPASFAFGILTALAAIWLVGMVREKKYQQPSIEVQQPASSS